MIRSFLKIAYYLVQFAVCVLLLAERLQTRRMPSAYARQGLPVTRTIYAHRYNQTRLRARPTLLPRYITWRRLFFLLS